MTDCLICLKGNCMKMSCCQAHFHRKCLQSWFDKRDLKCPHCQTKLQIKSIKKINWICLFIDLTLIALVFMSQSFILTLILYFRKIQTDQPKINNSPQHRIQAFLDYNKIVLSDNELIIFEKFKNTLFNFILAILGLYFEYFNLICILINSINLIYQAIKNDVWIQEISLFDII